jgi:hypothetical protein
VCAALWARWGIDNVLELILAILLIVLLIYAFLLRLQVKHLRSKLERNEWMMRNARAADNALVISVLVREIANELMQRDAQLYKDKFNRLFYKWQEIKVKDKSAKLAHVTTITSKYPNFSNFDELGTRAHVVYADGFSWISNDDLWDLYEAMRLFDALSCDLDEDWRGHGTSITETELEHLKEYCAKLSDTMLLAHLHKARDMYRLLRANDVEEKSDSEWIYETIEYKIRRVYHVAESRFGVYVKSLDRYGMWGLFSDTVSYTSFYAADADFKEEYLDNLNIRMCVSGGEYRSIEKEKW